LTALLRSLLAGNRFGGPGLTLRRTGPKNHSMDQLPIRFQTAVTLVGAGAFDLEMVEAARRLAPVLIAADGGAERLAALRLAPQAVIGDMDSLADPERWRTGPAHFVHLAEQDSTDFEKCLYATEAPLYLAVGFTGRRIDHTLAALHAMMRYPAKRVILVGEDEVSALARPGSILRLAVTPGARVSIYPLLPVTATHSRGLTWPVDGLAFAPGRRIGTSNAATQPVIELAFDGPGALVMVEREALGALAGAMSGV
jgi:thiamine pyrophosphokinase